MTLTASRPTDAHENAVLTPTVSRVIRRSAFWVGLAVAAVVIAIAVALLGGAGSGGAPLSPTSPAPGGAKAIVEVLRQQGVDVTVASTLEEAERAVGDPAATTLVLHDLDDLLEADQRARVGRLADTVILIDPSFSGLESLAPAIAQAGDVDGAVDADCTVLDGVGSVTVDGSGYRVIDDGASSTTCLGSGDGVYSVITVLSGDASVTVLGTTRALSNEIIGEAGNAALALRVLGQHPELVWYVPGYGDLAEGEAPPTLGELSPDWLPAVTTLLALTAVAAAVWRGRRFGPLIIENLPVVVRSSETMQGRARLYERGSARLHALDALRIGTIERIAAQCGLPRITRVEGVVATASAVTGMPQHAVRALLIDAHPATDADLVRLSDDLLEFEHAVSRATRPD